jgi:predicted RNA polymerase sigma factor
VQARIAACHATAASFTATDWATIVACYDELLAQAPNPVAALNRTVAVAMSAGPDRALPLLDDLVADPALARSHRVWAVRADLRRRTGDHSGAAADYDRALALVDNEVERRYLADMRRTCRTDNREEPC